MMPRLSRTLIGSAAVAAALLIPATALGGGGPAEGVGTISWEGTQNPPDSSTAFIHSFSWGVSNSGASSGHGGGSGKASFQDLHFVLRPSPSLPRLAYATASGKHLKNVRIDLHPDGVAEGIGVGVSFCAQDVTVRRVRHANIGSSGEDGVSVDLGYGKLSVQTTLSVGGLAVASFDPASNRATWGGSDACFHLP